MSITDCNEGLFRTTEDYNIPVVCFRSVVSMLTASVNTTLRWLGLGDLDNEWNQTTDMEKLFRLGSTISTVTNILIGICRRT